MNSKGKDKEKIKKFKKRVKKYNKNKVILVITLQE